MSEKPFWEGKTLMEIQNLDKRVKVTMENGDVFIGKLVRRSRDADGMCSLSMQLDAHRTYLHVFSAESFDTQPVIPSYVDTVELVDDPEYERIEGIYRIDTGDVVVCRSGNKYPVVGSTTHELRIEVENYGDVFISREDALFGLRPKPKLPDHDGLWLDKGDGLWLVTGTTVIEIAPKDPPAASISYPASSIEASERLSLFAPFRPAKAVEA